MRKNSNVTEMYSNFLYAFVILTDSHDNVNSKVKMIVQSTCTEWQMYYVYSAEVYVLY